MLTWPDDIGEDFEYHIGNEPIRGLRGEVAFVAIKNGSHNGIGYMLDTGATDGAGGGGAHGAERDAAAHRRCPGRPLGGSGRLRLTWPDASGQRVVRQPRIMRRP